MWLFLHPNHFTRIGVACQNGNQLICGETVEFFDAYHRHVWCLFWGHTTHEVYIDFTRTEDDTFDLIAAVVGAGVMASTRLCGEMASACAGPSEGSEALYRSDTLYQMAQDVTANTIYMGEVVAKCEFRLDEMAHKAKLDYAGTSEAHDRLVYDFGVPFRLGHRILGAMVRAHYYGEAIPDLNAMLRAETGKDFNVDQNEIMDIVLCKIIWPTTIDTAELKVIRTDLDAKAKAATAAFAGPSVAAQALDKVVQEGRAFAA